MKSKRTRATEISRLVKQKVWERQNGCSIISGYPIDVSECCCHFVPRSKGGLGVEENIIGLTPTEHMIFDNNHVGAKKEVSIKWREIARKHLMKHYPDWNEEKLRYKK